LAEWNTKKGRAEMIRQIHKIWIPAFAGMSGEKDGS